VRSSRVSILLFLLSSLQRVAQVAQIEQRLLGGARQFLALLGTEIGTGGGQTPPSTSCDPADQIEVLEQLRTGRRRRRRLALDLPARLEKQQRVGQQPLT
jgi:hypothetical protein